MVVQRKGGLLALLAVGAVASCVLMLGASSGQSATKAPIKIGLVGDIVSPTQSFKEAVSAVEARTKVINAAGGIKGRKIQLIKCDAKSDPNVAAACAQKFVTDKVVAVANPFSITGGSTVPVLSKAKIASVGNPVLANQYTDRYSYVQSAGSVGAYFAAGQYAGEKGCQRAGVISTAIGAYQAASVNAKRAFQAKGGRIVSDQSPPPGAPDFTPYVQSIVNSGATCVLYNVPVTDTTKVVTGVRQSSKPNLLIVGSASAYDGLALGSLGNGLIGSSTTAPRDRFDKSVSADHKKYAKNVRFNSFFIHGYLTMKVIEQGLRAVKGSVTNVSFVKALDSIRKIDTAGIVAPFSYRGLPFSNPTYARMAVRTAYIMEVRGGKSVLRKIVSLNTLG